METLVYDTAAIFNFGHRDDLALLLAKLAKAHTLLTTPSVVGEIRDPHQTEFYRKLLADFFSVRAVSVVPFDRATLTWLSQALDGGEISVLMLAKELEATAVLDEKAARSEARRLGVKFTGTLGLLRMAVERKWMKDAECLACIRHLCASDFRIPRPEPQQTFADYIGGFH